MKKVLCLVVLRKLPRGGSKFRTCFAAKTCKYAFDALALTLRYEITCGSRYDLLRPISDIRKGLRDCNHAMVQKWEEGMYYGSQRLTRMVTLPIRVWAYLPPATFLGLTK